MTPEQLRTRETAHVPELNYLIVGYGNFGQKRHAILKEKCIATVSRNPSRGADYLTSADIPQELVDKVQAVVVTIPDPAKYAEVAHWIARRKNVFVEKPFLATEVKFQHLLKLSQENHVIWRTAYNLRSEPNIQKMKEFIDQGFLGNIYHARLCYGFGNARQLAGSWRDKELGALADVGSHLVDLGIFLFGYNGDDFEAVNIQKVEWTQGPDHCQFRTKDRKIFFEASMLHWKNEFTVDIFGENGSVHINSLCKWGQSELLINKRVFPAGVPEEVLKVIIRSKGDPTLTDDFRNFEKAVRLQETSFIKDIATNQALLSIWKTA